MPLSDETEARLQALADKFEVWRSETFSEAKLTEAKLQARFWIAAVGACASGVFFLVAIDQVVELERVVNKRIVIEATFLEVATGNLVIGGGFFFVLLYLAVAAGTTKGAWGGRSPRAAPKTRESAGTDTSSGEDGGRRWRPSPPQEQPGLEEGRRKNAEPQERNDSGSAFPSIWRGR